MPTAIPEGGTATLAGTYADNPTGQPTGSYPISASVADQTGLSTACRPIT